MMLVSKGLTLWDTLLKGKEKPNMSAQLVDMYQWHMLVDWSEDLKTNFTGSISVWSVEPQPRCTDQVSSVQLKKKKCTS